MSFPAPTPRQARVIWFALTTLAVASTVAIIGAVLWGLGRLIGILSPVLLPIAIASIIAFILDPVVDWLELRGLPRLRAILLVFGLSTVVVMAVFASVVPALVIQARDLASRLTDYGQSARRKIDAWINDPRAPLLKLLPNSWRLGGTNSVTLATNPAPSNAIELAATNEPVITATPPESPVVPLPTPLPAAGEVSWWIKAVDPAALRTAGDWVANILPDVGRWILGQLGRVASWFGVVAGLALIPIYAFYFLLEKRSIERQWTDYLPVSDSRFKDELVWLLRNINDALIVFFRGQVLVALCDGVMYSVGFLIVGLPYALLLGLVATVLTIVPFLGAIVTCVSALLIAIIQFGDWTHPLLVLLVFVTVQTIEGWIIQPKIIGDRVGLHPVSIIIALLVGATLLGGILGGLLAIPTTAVIRALLFRYVWRPRTVLDRSTAA